MNRYEREIFLTAAGGVFIGTLIGASVMLLMCSGGML